MKIKADVLKKFIAALLVKLGAAENIAGRWAMLLVETSLLGFDSHGVRMLERYVKHIEDGGINLKSRAEIISQKGACLVLDAHAGLGHITADEAMDMAIAKAREFGIACVTARNSNHIGACGLYSRKAALQDAIGICTTISRGVMAPWGGKQALLGSNPVSLAAPIAGKPPFLFDAATTVVAMGQITRAMDMKKEIPPDWALDRNGNPTVNPQEAVSGTLLPMAGHKGYGLALGMEILASVLSGGLFSSQVHSWISQTARPTGACFTLIVMDISAFQDVHYFKSRMKEFVETITGSEKRPGMECIYYPGEREGQTMLKREAEGIDIEKEDEAMFLRLAGRFNLEPPDGLKA